MTEELSSINAFVYHVSQLSKNWEFSNPYFLGLKAVLLDEAVVIDTKTLSEGQEYHFIAKMISDEYSNKNGVESNVSKILSQIEKYLLERNVKVGANITLYLFYAAVMEFNGKGQHFNGLDKRSEKIKAFLGNFKASNSNLSNMEKILSLIYGVEAQDSLETNDNLDLALNSLYDRIALTKVVKRDKGVLADYYLKQYKLENSGLSKASFEKSRGNAVEIAVILKSAAGKGLYIPEIEKEQYLSGFTQKLFREKYAKYINESNSFKLWGLNLPSWFVVLCVFILEAIIFYLPNFGASIQIGFLSIPTNILLELPIWAVLIIDGGLIALYIYIQQKKINKKLGEEQWK